MNTKKLFSALLSVLIVLMMLPSAAFAAGEDVPNVLYVGTTNIGTTSYNDNAAYWTSEDGGTTWNSQQTQPEGDSYIYYDGQGTLDLHNVTIQGQYDDSNVFGAGIYALCGTNQSVSLTIQLTGNNTITGDFGIYVEAQQGGTLGANASLSITGDGSLTVTGTASYGLYVKSGTGNASLTIENASVDATSSVSYISYADVCVGSSDSATAPALSLAVNGGSLTTSGSANGKGIQFYVGAYDATSATTSLTVTDNAIVDARTGGISASGVSVNPNVNIGSTGSTGGIVWNGAEGTVYGDVTLDESLTVGEGETLTIPERSSLDMNGNTITVESGGKLEGTPTGNGTVKIAPTITTESLPDGEVGTAYSQTLTATGDAPITWTVSGTLPAGLALNSDGTITGTPTTAGSSTFTVTAENSAGSTSREYTLTIGVKPSYTISADTAALSFGSVLPGYTQPEAVTVTVTNTGNQPLTLDQPASTANFEVGTLSATDLPVHGTATFTVQSKAGLPVGTYSENIVVTASHDVEISIPGSFTVVATDDPLVDTSLTVTPGISAGILGTAFDTAEKVRTELARVLVQDAAYTAENTAFYGVKLQYSLDDGKTWVEATEASFPAEGITVTLPYPQGTGKDTHNFRVVHMFTETSARLGTTAGQTETPGVTKTDSGLQVTLKGLSPVVIGWSKIAPQTTATPAPATTSPADTTTYYTCPACGTHNWTATDNGYRCDNCGYLESVKQLSGYGNVKGTYTPGSNSSAAAAGAVSAPPTGDTSNPVLWTVVLAAACLTLGVATWAKRRQD